MFRERSSDLQREVLSHFSVVYTHGSLRICVCVAFSFNRKDSHGALAIKQLVHRVLVPRLTRSDRKGSTMLKRSSVAPSPCLRSFRPWPERLSRAMRRRCNASSKLEQMSNSRTRRAIARGPWSLRRCEPSERVARNSNSLVFSPSILQEKMGQRPGSSRPF